MSRRRPEPELWSGGGRLSDERWYRYWNGLAGYLRDRDVYHWKRSTSDDRAVLFLRLDARSSGCLRQAVAIPGVTQRWAMIGARDRQGLSSLEEVVCPKLVGAERLDGRTKRNSSWA